MSSPRLPRSEEQSRIHYPGTPDKYKPSNKCPPHNQWNERYHERLRYKRLFLRELKPDAMSANTQDRMRNLEETEVHYDSKQSHTFNEAFSSNASYRESDIQRRDERENAFYSHPSNSVSERLRFATYNQSHKVEHYYYICVGSPVNTALGPLRMQERRVVQRLLNLQVSHSEGYNVKGSWLATVWYCSLENLRKDLENHRIYPIAKHISNESAPYFGDMPTTICLGSKSKADGSHNNAIWISYVRVPAPASAKSSTSHTEEQTGGFMETKMVNGCEKGLAPIETLYNVSLTLDHGESTTLPSNTPHTIPKTQQHLEKNLGPPGKYLYKKWVYKSTSRHYTGIFICYQRRRARNSSRHFFDYLRISISVKFSLSPAAETADSCYSQELELDPPLCMPGAWPEEVVCEPKSRPPWQMSCSSPGPYIPGAWPGFFHSMEDFIL